MDLYATKASYYSLSEKTVAQWLTQFSELLSPTIFINWSIIVITSYIEWTPRSPAEVCSTKILQPSRKLIKMQQVHINGDNDF
jgi:hypothetical protein